MAAAAGKRSARRQRPQRRRSRRACHRRPSRPAHRDRPAGRALGRLAGALRALRVAPVHRCRPDRGGRSRLVHQAADRLVPHGVVRAARRSAEHARQGTCVGREQGARVMARFGAVLTAMVTPFDGDGALNLDAAVKLAKWLTENGSDGLVLTGTTGEGPVLTDDEDVELWRAVTEAVNVPIIAGTGTNDTRHTIELTKRAAECGVEGALV